MKLKINLWQAKFSSVVLLCRQLKYYEHRIRSEIGISLEIIQEHIHQKDLNLFLHHVTVPRLLLNWKKHKQEIQLCYGAYNENIKSHKKFIF